MSICVIQFIKGSFVTGESLAAERLGIEFVSLGKGFFTIAGSDLQEHRSAAEKALAFAHQRMLSGPLDILILDEINNAVELGLLEITAVLDLVKNKPANLHLVLTGRNAHSDLISVADLVTEMHALKHPFDSGVPAQKGIDY
jgi:cob(I)alamin adenosyltransferase